MRILFVIPTLNDGGAEIQTIKMANYLCKNYDISVLTFTSNVNLLQNLNISSNKVHILDSKFNSFSFKKLFSLDFIKFYKDVKKTISAINAECVIANLPMSHLLMRLIKKNEAMYKLINIHHSLQFSAHKPHLLMRLFMVYMSRIANFTDDMNVFISNASKQDQLKLLKISLSKTKVIYNGVSIDTKVINKVKFHSKAFKIVMAGRFVDEKNHKIFVDALTGLLNEGKIHKQVVVYFLGDGPLRSSIESLVEGKFSDLFHFKGMISNQEVLNYFFSSDLVVIPSKSEGFGNVAVEAGLLGCQILSSNAGGLDEIIQHNINGFKFNNGDIKSLKKELIEIIDDNKQADKEAVIKSMKEKFSFENMMTNYIELLKSV